MECVPRSPFHRIVSFVVEFRRFSELRPLEWTPSDLKRGIDSIEKSFKQSKSKQSNAKQRKQSMNSFFRHSKEDVSRRGDGIAQR